jgi:hypothetical protein
MADEQKKTLAQEQRKLFETAWKEQMKIKEQEDELNDELLKHAN